MVRHGRIGASLVFRTGKAAAIRAGAPVKVESIVSLTIISDDLKVPVRLATHRAAREKLKGGLEIIPQSISATESCSRKAARAVDSLRTVTSSSVLAGGA